MLSVSDAHPLQPHSGSSGPVRTSGKFFRLGEEKWLLKGIAYGPFEGPGGYPPEAVARQDAQHMASLGFNVVRVYMPPPRWFCEACAEAGLRLLVGWPWPSHTDFLRSRARRVALLEEARAVYEALRGYPAILGFIVGNEVPAMLVRWMGRRRVRGFLEKLIALGRRIHPEALFAYATFPSTEYLTPRNADFFACNIYLEEREAFARYVERLHHVAGDKPLVISEFGLDTQRHGEAKQAEVLSWAWDTALRAGVAGQVVFSFTDEWFNDGRPMTEWSFGLVTAKRKEKKACAAMREWLLDRERPGLTLAEWRFRYWPRFSVIICTHNGSRTLRQALESLRRVTWRDFEVLLIDDGSSDEDVAFIAQQFPEVRMYRLQHVGLSAARNFGAEQAAGEVLVYLDDDATADEDWLTWLAVCFQDERVGAAGGPNIAPPAIGATENAIMCAPGSPAHVMLNDTEAEHLPGCNLAVRKRVWEEVGGFDERYRTAGDDVDFCWRVLEHGHRLRFHPAAMVWHERRRTARAYLRQQTGYGRAEALLIAQHRHRFGKLGGARWHGRIYEPAAATGGTFLYQGMFGLAPYQFLYTAPRATWQEVVLSPLWVALGLVLAGLTWWSGWLGGLLVPWLALPLAASWRQVREAQLPAGVSRRGVRSSLVLFGLSLVQPVVRGWARWKGCLKQRVFPQGPWIGAAWRNAAPRLGRAVAERAWWTAHGRDRGVLLAALSEAFAQTPWRPCFGDEWADWDVVIEPSRWWRVHVVTVTEYHQQGGCLTRLRLHSRARWGTRWCGIGTALVVAGLAVYQWNWGVIAVAVSLVLWGLLAAYHAAVIRLVMQVISHTARQHGLRLIQEDERARAEAEEADESEDDEEEAKPVPPAFR